MSISKSLDVLPFIQNLAEKKEEHLRQEICSLAQQALDHSQQSKAAVDKLRADQFVKNFPLQVELGILQWLEKEMAPIGDYEEPGARQYFMSKFRGWIPVQKIESQFQGSSNDQEFRPPNWLVYAIALLIQDGWEIELISHVFCELGIGNTKTAFLCIRDPRVTVEPVSS